MKKTLVLAFMGLGSVAYAGLTPDNADLTVLSATPVTYSAVDLKIGNVDAITASNQALTWAGGGTLTNYAVTVQITSLASANNGSPVFSLTKNASTGGADSAGMYVNAAGNTVTFCVGNTSQNLGSFTISNKDILTFISVQGAGETSRTWAVINQTSGEMISTSALNTGTGTTVLTSGTARLWTNGGKVQMATLGVADLTGVTGADLATYGTSFKMGAAPAVVDPDPATPNIPEPATATLSLLALAGLVSRRRRK